MDTIDRKAIPHPPVPSSERATDLPAEPARAIEESLDPADWEELRDLGHHMVDEMLGWLRGVRERPAWRKTPGALQEQLSEPLPLEPQGVGRAYADFQSGVLPYPLGNVHPRFWGWACGTGSPSAMLYEMLAAGMNVSSGAFDQSAIVVEERVLAWLGELFGFPTGASGLLVSGASMANLIGLAVARHARAGVDVRKHGLRGSEALTVYASSEVHSSVQRALELLGLGAEALHTAPVDAAFEADVPALRARIRADRAEGRQPIALVGTAGTVNTGAIDALEDLADLAQEEGLWFHVDAAIGAGAMLSTELAPRLAGIERADSVAFDLHKWMHVPYEAGCVLVRDAALHRETFTLTPPYLASHARGVLANARFMADYGPQLSRGFRALKIWMSFKEHGIARFGRLVERNCRQAALLASRLDAHPRLERLAPVPLNIVCFRYVGSGKSALRLDDLNRELLFRLQESGTCVPSSTLVNGRFALRVCIANHRTRDEDVELLVSETARLGDQLASEGAFHDVAN
jgi:glutamate/tyrosine decarboxylase-like PLP-dependent enzyme